MILIVCHNCVNWTLNINAIKTLLSCFLPCDCHSSQQLGFSQHALAQRNVFSTKALSKLLLKNYDCGLIEWRITILLNFHDVTVGDKQNIQVHVLEHLSKMEDKFQQYFPEEDVTRVDLSFIKDPFTTNVHTVPLDFEEKILKQ